MPLRKPKLQAFANRYVAELIVSAPPNEVDFVGEAFSANDRVTVYRVLEKVRERLLAEAEQLESLPVTHQHQGEAGSGPAR
ncbi:hypothetical protein [Phytopseudomonas seleniipraecipitans]|uniref:Uncharacterized protein n=1 Tax=Phytopseudomonas seleniipraecipitans TaxID=640205 RepID=A0A1G7JBQ3_9GAMM|nr:hypothetical protein [Pseudomonas seleniipraecipitans]SDF22194.1 hypothetical protein SAMN05216381_1055 [Pseudomonas seleniipraecipitans]